MKNNNNFKIEECKNDKIWDNFILESINKNFYSLSDLLNLDKFTKKYFLFKNNEIIASIALNIYKKKILLPNFRIYSPINYKKFQDSKLSSLNLYYYNVNKFIYEFLTNNFKNIEIIFDIFTKDLRPFLWHGFPEYKKKFKIGIKYTMESNITDVSESNFQKSCIYLNSSETNRREIRNSQKKKYLFDQVFSKNIFLNLKKSSFKIHNKKINIKYYEKLMDVYDKLNKRGLLKMFVTYLDNAPVFMTVFGILNSRAIFLESGRTKHADNKNLIGVYSLFKSFINLSKLGVTIVDFEGINSPNNSISKLKYGGIIKPYYSLKL